MRSEFEERAKSQAREAGPGSRVVGSGRRSSFSGFLFVWFPGGWLVSKDLKNKQKGK